jgi:hypothetical protein
VLLFADEVQESGFLRRETCSLANSLLLRGDEIPGYSTATN